MDADDFWALVESARTDAGERTDDGGEAVAAALVSRLAALPPQRILDFQQQLDQARGALDRWDVWAAAYLIGGGCSDDSFSDFRSTIVALGRAWHQRVQSNPDYLADHPMIQQAAADQNPYPVFAEPVTYVASYAYERAVSDNDADSFYDAWRARQRTAPSANASTEPDMGESFDFDDNTQMRRRLPQLARLFLATEQD
jgi:hypothetical protein